MFGGLARLRLECPHVAHTISKERCCQGFAYEDAALSGRRSFLSPRCFSPDSHSLSLSFSLSLSLSREREKSSRAASRSRPFCLKAMCDTCLTRVTCPRSAGDHVCICAISISEERCKNGETDRGFLLLFIIIEASLIRRSLGWRLARDECEENRKIYERISHTQRESNLAV